jgi:putative component of toxin-antitoxin plasmid stabilization module
MSIRTEWQSHVAAGAIYRVEPLAGDPCRRTVLVTKEIQEILTRPMEEGREADRRARLLQTLQGITSTRKLVVCLSPFKARRGTVIGRLDPVEKSIFDIRCEQTPGIRVFCQFIEKDVLFGMTCRPRSVPISWLGGWLPLGSRHSKQWKDGIRSALQIWPRYFPAHSPVSGDDLHVYLSDARLEEPPGGA